MINYINRDITTVTVGLVAHGVNCQGKMASGVAAAIRKKWPIVYTRYKRMPTGKTMLGTCQTIDVFDNATLIVANCYTQVFYGYGGGKYADADAIKASLKQAYMFADMYNHDVYMPMIGAGLGGLDWDKDVAPIIEQLDTTWPRVDTYVCVLDNKQQEKITELIGDNPDNE